jgi:D-sedoheptulose 7-phosphate isomerase
MNINSGKYISEEIKKIKLIFDQLSKSNLKIFNKLCNESVKSIKNKGKIFFIGNGGSAADSQHLAAELTVKLKKKRKAFPGIALTADNATITAIGNDYDFENIFSRQLEALGQENDICLALTTSGNSKNIIRACKTCARKKIKFFSIIGNNGGKLRKYTKNLIFINSKQTSLIQVSQIFIGQIYCEIIENTLLKK